MCLIATRQATEEFAAAFFHGFSAADGEPLPFRATSRTVVACSMRVRFYRDDGNCIRFFFAVLIDFAFDLIGLFAVESMRFGHPALLHHPQALENQDTARILGTHIDYLARNPMGCVFVHPLHMAPEILIASLYLDGPSLLPLF